METAAAGGTSFRGLVLDLSVFFFNDSVLCLNVALLEQTAHLRVDVFLVKVQLKKGIVVAAADVGERRFSRNRSRFYSSFRGSLNGLTPLLAGT